MDIFLCHGTILGRTATKNKKQRCITSLLDFKNCKIIEG